MSTTPESASPTPAPRKKSNASLRRSGQSTEQDEDKTAIPFNHFPKPEIIRDIKELINSSDLSQKKMALDLNISQTKVSQFLNNVPRTKGWGSFEEKVTIWMSEQRIKLGRVKEKEVGEKQAESNDIEVIPLSFSGHSTPVSDASMDSVAIQPPSPIYVVPYSVGIQPNGVQMWMPYSNPYQATSQLMANGVPALTKSFSWPQPRKANPYEGYFMVDSKSEYTPSPREMDWMASQHKMYSPNMFGNERMDAEPTSVQENDWSTFSLNEVFETKL